MFTMTGLQSQQSPLRTIESYYKPINRPSSKSRRKVFSKQQSVIETPFLQDIYNPQKKKLTIKGYLDSLNRMKGLPRKGVKRQEIHSFITFRKENDNNSITNRDQQVSRSIIMDRDKSLSSILGLSSTSRNSVSRTSSLCSILDKKRKDSCHNKWRQFQAKLSARQQESKKDMRFTFYNNQQKAKYIMNKYKVDEYLQQRGTNLYQNVFNRTLAKDLLLATMGQIEKKRRKGEIV